MLEIEIIKKSSDGKWTAFKSEDMGDYIGFFKGENKDTGILKTPSGNIVTTLYPALAERIIDDLEKYGYHYTTIDTILSWHFTLLDNFKPMQHEKIEQILDDCFLKKQDWTMDSGITNESWVTIFGRPDERRKEIRAWLSKCTHMQMTAACCIGNAYHSLNMAFVLARIMEMCTGEERQAFFVKMSILVGKWTQGMYDEKELLNDMETFELYYGIHLDEHGPAIENKPDGGDDFDGFIGKKVTVEQLVGRNYYHYTDGKKDESQPFKIIAKDFDFDEDDDQNKSDGEELDVEDDDLDECYGEELEDYVDGECWIKRLVADEGDERYYLIALSVSKDGIIENVEVIEETVERMGGGFFIIPDMELDGESSYETVDYVPDEVREELEKLMAGRVLTPDTTFIGKPLPDGFDDETIYIRSAFRLAYLDADINLNEDGMTIESFDYSTDQTTGNSYNDMFMRPHYYENRNDEAIDALLYLLDQYSDEEYEKLFK